MLIPGPSFVFLIKHIYRRENFAVTEKERKREKKEKERKKYRKIFSDGINFVKFLKRTI